MQSIPNIVKVILSFQLLCEVACILKSTMNHPFYFFCLFFFSKFEVCAFFICCRSMKQQQKKETKHTKKNKEPKKKQQNCKKDFVTLAAYIRIKLTHSKHNKHTTIPVVTNGKSRIHQRKGSTICATVFFFFCFCFVFVLSQKVRKTQKEKKRENLF